ncbi:O-antigen ligase [Rhizobium sp.]|jgi:exopolysaccharide production protein ExoQ|uniref:O-antigen ligase family protein n=1 Tax=Rhizobium sp. TaxID=391 RepID=UPI000E8D64A9|nr:exopolysaccharide biosynthesis protein [Rhizobium sp.]
MRIAKAQLIDPERNEIYAITAVTLSLFAFAYSSLFGQLLILMLYALWFPLVAVNYRRVLGHPGMFLPIMAFSLLAIASVMWSAAPSVTARASLQFFTHILCTLIAARVVNINSFIKGALLGSILCMIYSLLFGYYLLDPLDGTVSFVGAFSSKNQLGLHASLGVYYAFAAVVILRMRGLWLLVAAVSGVFSVYCLKESESATSVLTILAVIGASLVLRGVDFLSPRHRIVLFLAGSVLGGLCLGAFIYSGGIDLVLGAFGKDSTLTGRTYLWQQGYSTALLNPFFGVGYQAYWVQGFSEAERLWDEFYIETRAGFHFHNTYIETAVELGLVGLLMMITMLLTAFVGTLKRLLTNINDPEAGVLFGLAMLLLERSFVEIDVLFAYQIGSFLLFFILGKLALRKARARVSNTSLVRYYGIGVSAKLRQR